MLKKLQFTPGVNRDQTNYTNEGGWYECDKIRFRSGQPQKLGGWLIYPLYSLTTYLATTLAGICRQMFTWVTTTSDNIMAIGTNEKLYINTGNYLVNITPLRATFTTPSTNNCIATTIGSNVVTVTITGFGSSTGDWMTFSGAAAVGGIPASELNTDHQITKVNADKFTFTTTTLATSTVAAGGGVGITAYFEIPVGNAYTTLGYGWGAGAWSRGPWGSGSATPVVNGQRDWFFDNFNDALVANIRDGAPYYWEFVSTYNTRAVLLSSLVGASDVPTTVGQLLVSQGDRHLLAFGATPYGGGSFDPLLIRWSNQDEPQNFTPEVTNSAGYIRVSRGSKIVRAIPTRQEIVVFTNATLNSLQFLGTTDVFGIQELSDNISIASPRACIAVNNIVFWMGTDKFYMYSGRVDTLPCTLRNHVFENINYAQLDQVVCGTNEQWNEIWWFYPTADSSVNNAYVIYNHLDKIWYYGSMNRTAWNDSPLREYPQAVSGSYVYNHEQGVDDDVSPMTSYISSSDFDIGDGEEFTLIKRIIPDVDFTGSDTDLNPTPTATFTMRPRNFPGSNYGTSPAKNVITADVTTYTNQVFLRARARQMAMEISSSDLGVQWQLGSPRLDGRPDGKR